MQIEQLGDLIKVVLNRQELSFLGQFHQVGGKHQGRVKDGKLRRLRQDAMATVLAQVGDEFAWVVSGTAEGRYAALSHRQADACIWRFCLQTKKTQ